MPPIAGPFERGSTIYVQMFHHNQMLPVEIVDAVSITHGVSARVYRGLARLPHYSYYVALKVIPHVMGEEREELIRRELETVAQLSERSMRHILPFIGTASLHFYTIIASVYMENGHLLQYFETNPDADRQQLLIQVAEAAHCLHECINLVHGDLKCENVLVNNNGDAMLADFGLATLVEKDASSVTTVTWIRDMNTLRFAAPELLLGPENDDVIPTDGSARPRSKTCKSDVYAFGMLVLQAFTGMRPWVSLGNNEVILKIAARAVHPRPADDVTMVGLTDSWWAVCLECWNRQPQARPTMHWIWETLASHKRQSRVLGTELVHLALSPCGKRIVSESDDETIWVCDAATGDMLCGPLLGLTADVDCISESPDGLQLALGCSDSTIHRRDASSGVPIGDPMRGHGARVNALAYSQDGTRIVSGSDDHTLLLWDAPTGSSIGDPLRGHVSYVCSVAFSHNGECIASGSFDSSIRLWDGATREPRGVLEWHNGPVFSVAFSSDRIHLVSGSGDMRVGIWNISTQQLERSIFGHSAGIRSVAVSPSGRYIASGSHDKTVRIWDAQTGQAVGPPLTGSTDYIRAITFASGGRSLISVLYDGTARIWDLFV